MIIIMIINRAMCRDWPHSGPGCWEEPRTAERKPPQKPRCYQPETSRTCWCLVFRWTPTVAPPRPAPASYTSPAQTTAPPPTLTHPADFNVRVSVCVSNVPLRHRSPQCRVCLYAGTGSCLFRPDTERRRRCCSDSRLYMTSWFLQRGKKQIEALCCSWYSHKTSLLQLANMQQSNNRIIWSSVCGHCSLFFSSDLVSTTCWGKYLISSCSAVSVCWACFCSKTNLKNPNVFLLQVDSWNKRQDESKNV